MINAKVVNRVSDEGSTANYWSVLKRQVSESPLAALGVAAGAGLLISALLKPRPRRQNFIGKAAHAVSARSLRSSANKTFKSFVGSLALRYLNRKLNSKMRWR